MINQKSSQGELFQSKKFLFKSDAIHNELYMNRDLIENWQKKICYFQSKLFYNDYNKEEQYSLFSNSKHSRIESLSPLELTPLPLNFWKWSNPPHNGPAIYLVIDRTEKKKEHLLLYIGETISADKRWKGEHDCKTYLSHYCAALQKANIKAQLSIRFWIDVPKDTRSRRKLEQELIQKWLPPFNKETRNHWQTPFTSEVI